MRKAAYVVAAVFVVSLLLVTILPRVVSLDGMTPSLIAAIEENTGRKATVKKVSLSLFPGIGIRVRELTLSGDPGRESEKLLDAPEAEFRLAIMPLLSGHAVFSRIIVVRPAILFRKYLDGTTSVSEMSRRLSAPTPSFGTNGGGRPSVAIDSIDIRDARVALRLQGPEGRVDAYDIAPVTARFGRVGGPGLDFDIAARFGKKARGHLALAGSLEPLQGEKSTYLLKAEGDLFRQDLSVEGKIATAGPSPELDLALSMPRVRMGDLPETFREPPAALAEGHLEGFGSLSAKLSGTPEALGFEIDADLNDAGWTVVPGLQKFIDMPCSLVVQGRRFPDQLVLSNAELRFPPLLLIGNLSGVPSTGAYEWSASSRIASLGDFAKSRGELLARWSPTGRITASGHGKKSSRDADGSWEIGVDLVEVGFQESESRMDFRSLDGHLGLTPGAVEFSPLAGLFNGQSFSLRGKMALGKTAAEPLELKMAFLDLDALFPAGGHGRKGETVKEGPSGSGGSGKAKSREVSFLANLSIDAGRAKGVGFRDLSGRIGFEKGIHSFENLKVNVFGGEAEATGRVDTTGRAPDIRAKIMLRNVEAAQLLASGTTLGNFISGSVTMNAELAAGIGDFGEFARTATGDGTLSVSGGKVRGIDLRGEASWLAGLSGSVPARGGETPFSKLSAGFRIGGGRISTDSLRIEADRLGLAGTAAIGFDRTVDFVGTVSMPNPLTGRPRGTAGKYFERSAGRIEIPLVVSGALTSPAMAIDSAALARGAGK